LNILFIMYDQLRFDYLGCAGHPYLATPNFERVTCSDTDVEARRGRSARRGVLPFLRDGSEVPEELTSAYRGPVAQNHLSSCGRKPAIHHGHTGSLK